MDCMNTTYTCIGLPLKGQILKATFLTLSGNSPYIFGKETIMQPNQPTRSARLEARITPDALAIVKRAAELQGRSISDFVVAAAQEVAQRTIGDAQLIRLSVEDQRTFAEALANPPPMNAAMKRAQQAHARLIAKGR
jgi:uncharacterized protein (DUF1778 family)